MEAPASLASVQNISAQKGGTVCAPVIDRTNIQGPLTVITHIHGGKETSSFGSGAVKAGGSPDVAAVSAELITLCKQSHRSKLEKFRETISNHGSSTPLNEIYTELYITEGGSGEVNNEHEVRNIEMIYRKQFPQETPIKCNDIFKPLPGQDKVIRTVLTRGVAGIGKTVSVQKFILDWAEGKANQDISFIFPLPFRELNLMKHKKLSLIDLLHSFFPQSNALPLIQSNANKLIFVFDGLDECRLTLDFQNNDRLCECTESASVDVLLTNLINGNLLPSALLWITTRPAAASQIPPVCVDQITEVRGFNDPQKEEYFRKRISDQSLAERIITHIKSSRSLYIMCHIPVFCWIAATVLKRMLSKAEGGEIPKTLTQMFIYFLNFQIKRDNQQCDTDHVQTRKTVLALGKLAFQQLEKGNLIFYEEDLRECGIDVSKVSIYSGVCTQIFREEFELHLGKVFSFVHLSVQEFLAALYAFLSFVSDHRNVVLQQATGIFDFFKKPTISDFLNCAVDKALKSENGHLDLFLRFLLGLSLESNQTILKGLLPQTESNSYSKGETVKYLKEKIGENPYPEKFINLFHCLNELNDHSLVQEVQKYLNRGSDGHLIGAKLSSAQWSAVVFILLNSQAELDEFNLSKFDSSEECLLKLMPVIKASRKVILCECNLTEKSYASLTSALSSVSANLRELNLSKNELQDSKVKLLSTGLENPYCKVQILRLCDCNITEEGCAVLVKALKLNPSHLRQLDLSYNKIEESGVKELSDLLQNPHCKLEKLLLEGCSLTDEGCAALISSEALKSTSSHLRELNLSDNKLGHAGEKELSDLLKHQNCKLENLQLCNCNLTDESCRALAAALNSSTSSLRELNLSYNKLQDSGVKLLAAGLKKPHCKLKTLWLEVCSITEKGCAALVKALKSNAYLLTELNLNSNNPGEAGVKELADLLVDPHSILEKLQLCGCSLTKKSLAILVSALSSKSSSLRELNLSYNTLQLSEVKLLSDGLMNPHCKLETLRLEGCNITEEGCAHVVKALKSNASSYLRELNLNRNEPGELGVKELCDLLEDPLCNLEKLYLLEFCRFREKDTVSQASILKIMRDPEQNCSKAPVNEAQHLQEDLCCTLENIQICDPSNSQELILNFKNVGDSGVELLSGYLKSPRCKVEKLLMRWCNLTDKSCAILASVLSSNSRLRELNLSKNILQDSGVMLLSAGLENPKCKLNILSLCGCSLTDRSCASLALALRSTSSRLKELHLNNNKLQDLGVNNLCAGLVNQHCKLEILGLKCCNITETGCAALTNALKSNSSSRLRKLNLSFNKPGETGVKELSDLLNDPKCKLEIIEF